VTGSFFDKVTARQRDSLERHWQTQAKSLLERDGTSEKHVGGGHRIKQNPLLIRAIEEIRDRYFDLYLRKMPLVKRLEAGDKSVQVDIDDVDYDLIMHNKNSFERLQKPFYGFSEAQAKEILGTVPQDAIAGDLGGLEKKDAAKIT